MRIDTAERHRESGRDLALDRKRSLLCDRRPVAGLVDEDCLQRSQCAVVRDIDAERGDSLGRNAGRISGCRRSARDQISAGRRGIEEQSLKNCRCTLDQPRNPAERICIYRDLPVARAGVVAGDQRRDRRKSRLDSPPGRQGCCSQQQSCWHSPLPGSNPRRGSAHRQARKRFRIRHG